MIWVEDMNGNTCIHEPVDVSEIKKSYLISELSKAVGEKDARLSFVEKLGDCLDKLDSGELDGLTKLISTEYRKNAVYQQLMSHFDWYRIEADIDHIFLTETNDKENAALATLSPPWNLGSLVKKIRATDREDLEKVGLGDFLGKGDFPNEPPIAICENVDNEHRIKLIDGMHRTPSLFMGNEDQYLTLHVGRNN